MLATDGLTGHVSDTAIEGIMEHGASARETAGKLIAVANENGGWDNTTVVVARFGSPAMSADTTVRMAAVALPDPATAAAPASGSSPMTETAPKGGKDALPELPQIKSGDAEPAT